MYILKLGLVGFVGFVLEYEREREIKGFFKVLGLSSRRDGVVIY